LEAEEGCCSSYSWVPLGFSKESLGMTRKKWFEKTLEESSFASTADAWSDLLLDPEVSDIRDRTQVVNRAQPPKNNSWNDQGREKCTHYSHCWEKVSCEQCKGDIRKRSFTMMVDQI
jgi:hypothetical protein